MSKKNTAIENFLDEKYIPLEPKAKIAIAVILLVVPLLLFYFFVFKPNNERQAQLDSQKQNLISQIDIAKKSAAKKGEVEKELAIARERFEETKSMLPEEQEIPELLKTISSLGQVAGLDFISFTPGTPTPKDFYSEIPLNIDIRGPYHNVGYFLDQVSKLDRIVTVMDITMTSPKKDAGEIILSSKCKLVSYFFTNQALAQPTQQ